MTTPPTTPSDPTLTNLLRERQFYAALLVGLPGLAYAYVELARGVFQREPVDVAAVGLALSANPVVLYLLARQYARGKSAEAVGVQLAAEAHALGEAAFAPSVDEAGPVIDDGFGTALADDPSDDPGEGPERVVELERIDAEAER